ncbi:MAG: hypothetical protein CM1200mP2_55330 [Planctomycetaceae bacterium]|nr:MAG: hypothetical protein CM1200mP2_55330 [Planctomycetaceae bacterium]
MGVFLGVTEWWRPPRLGISLGCSTRRNRGPRGWQTEDRGNVLYKATAGHTNSVITQTWCDRGNGCSACGPTEGRGGEVGQRILYSTAQVGRFDKWSAPRELARDPSDQGACVAAGWLVNGPTLIAYYTVTGGTNFDPELRSGKKCQPTATSGGVPTDHSGFLYCGPGRMGEEVFFWRAKCRRARSRRMAIFRHSDLRPWRMGWAKIAPRI